MSPLQEQQTEPCLDICLDLFKVSTVYLTSTGPLYRVSKTEFDVEGRIWNVRNNSTNSGKITQFTMTV